MRLLSRFSGNAEQPGEERREDALTIVWLLGKTGAGKSSIIQCLTGMPEAAIGDGLQSCTRTSEKFDYPPDQPLVRFLDTRGLGEAGYDPAEDLAACRGHAHAVVVVCRLDDPVQGEVADALAEVSRSEVRANAVLVHTGADLLPEPEAQDRARSANAKQIERAAGRKLASATVALPPNQIADETARDALVELLLDVLPEAGLLLERQTVRNTEDEAFKKVRKRVLFYSGLAGTTDLAPVVGAVSVPATQMAMLRELGNAYGVPWTRKLMAGFAGALGLGFGARFAGSYGLRQLGKLVPGYGQTIGAAFSGTVSFAVTYALGRTAAYYLHVHAKGETPGSEDLKSVYRNAFKRASHAPD